MDEISFSARPSLSTREIACTLTPDRLVWRVGEGQAQYLAYAEISALRLVSYATLGGTGYECTVRASKGRSLKLRSQHFLGVGRFENRVSTYAPFVRALAARVADHSPGARFLAGSTGLWIAWLAIGIGAAIVLVLLGLAALGGASFGASGIPALAIVVLGIPLAVREMRKGRARSFDPRNPPDSLTGSAGQAAT